MLGRFLKSSTQPHESVARPLQRAAGHIKETRPLLIPVAVMGKCKQANEFQLRHYDHMIINYSWAKLAQFAIQGSPTLNISNEREIYERTNGNNNDIMVDFVAMGNPKIVEKFRVSNLPPNGWVEGAH